MRRGIWVRVVVTIELGIGMMIGQDESWVMYVFGVDVGV